MRKSLIDEEPKLLAQLEEQFKILTDGRTIEDQRLLLFQAMRVGEMSRWSVAVELVQSLITREIQWWIDESTRLPPGDDRRQHGEVFLALTRLLRLLPLNGEDLRLAAVEVEN